MIIRAPTSTVAKSAPPRRINQHRHTSRPLDVVEQGNTGGRGRGRGRFVRGRRRSVINCAAFGLAPPAAGGAPQAAQGEAAGVKNYTKHYNNWNMCISCGFDVPGWHTSASCPAQCRKPGHQEGCDRQNYQQYVAQGHTVNLRKAHKNILLLNLQAHQA